VREREEHGRRLQNEFRAALRLADEMRPTDDRLEPLRGTFVEVELLAGTSPDVLERKRDKVWAGAVTLEANGNRKVVLFIPDGKREVFDGILADYRGAELTEDRRNPPHKALVEAIQAFRMARLESFWTDERSALPTDPQHEMWWALWCLVENEAAVEQVCARLDLRTADRDRRLYFPEMVVIPVLARRAAIELMLFATDLIAELRRANDTPSFFTDEVRGDQHAWSDNLAERITWPASDVPRVCILDTGVNRAHALLEPALASADLHALDAAWSSDDHEGHGTGMCGLALYGDLTAALGDRSQRVLTHRLESVKILPPRGFAPNQPQSYGALSQAAVARPEITAPDAQRVFCMSITNEDVSGATPSSWSAALDQIASGTMPGDDTETTPKRLFIMAAGNVPAEISVNRIQPQDNYPIEDPAQAWNVLTVGGYTDRITIAEPDYTNWLPMTDAGKLSPHSRTSVLWPQDRSPFKPELVFEAGNRIVNPQRTEALTVSSLSLLSTGHDAQLPLVPFEATSAASAQAARMAAQIKVEHPDYWPETVRALMVHSAEWTAPMWAQLAGHSGKRQRYNLVRQFGYGVPSLDRALASAQNDLALVAQAEIQPFRVEGRRKFNECHYYRLPIPRVLLEQLRNEPVDLKITLSYFVEPNPGRSANIDPQRYQSYGLRFDLRRKGETLTGFKKRVNASAREDPMRRPSSPQDDERWMLGARSVSAGSLHCDVWSGPAIELLERDTLCIKPVNGWWRNRASPEVCNRRARYSLVVGLKTTNVEVDVYTSISTAVSLPTAVEVET
jgi:hypothetical protein